MTESRWKYYGPAVIWAVLILVVSSIPNLSTPKFVVTFWDKIAHFSEYFILGLLTARAVRGFIPRPWSVFLISSVVAGVFGILDETHQLFVPGRTFDPLDMAANAIGALLSSALYVRFFQKRSVSRS